MRFTALSLLAAATTAVAQTATSSSPFTVYTLTADNITAKFIPYGARLTSLLVPDRNGKMQDIAVGYDNATQYAVDTATNHTFFGAIVGRFANRIRNGTFTIDGITSHIPENENGGKDTLHGGLVGYDARNWTVTQYTNDSITFTLYDQALEGFPGTVLNVATYHLSTETTGSAWGTPHPRLTCRTTSMALDQTTPIMTANHIYWNLNAFSAATIENDTTLWMPYSTRTIDTDGILIPTGNFTMVDTKPVVDFLTPKLIGDAINDPSAVNNCGTGCTGIDTAFTIERPRGTGPEASNFPVLSLWSQNTGIRLDVATNQIGLQIYSCNGQNGTIPVKQSQIDRNQQNGVNGTTVVNKYGCLVIETQAYIDGVNHPEWGVTDYINYGPNTMSAENYATYDFTTY